MTRVEAERYDRVGAQRLRARIASGPSIVQGPMGSLLMSEVGAVGIPPAYWNVAEPAAVARMHALYAAAGADILITNTFCASAPALERDGIVRAMDSVCRSAVDAARRAGGLPVLGSIGPVGIDWTREKDPEWRRAREAYQDMAHSLLVSGASGLLLETFGSMRELELALDAVNMVRDGMPVIVSFAVDGAGDLVGDGTNVEGALLALRSSEIDAVGVNCCELGVSQDMVGRMARASDLPLMIRPSAGLPETLDGELVWHEDPRAFAAALPGWIDAGATMVGSCCGASPRTTSALACALGDLLGDSNA